MAQSTLYNNTFFQAEAMYEQHGAKLRGNANLIVDNNGRALEVINLHSVKCTFNLGKKIGMSEANCFLIGAGAYIAYDMRFKDEYGNELSENTSFSGLGPTALIGIENERMQFSMNFAYNIGSNVEGYRGGHHLSLKAGVIYFFNLDD